ncbi:FkbM family methyltransferase [Xanthocytophaga agilis]|uniref:FkbM family methyltransferase n=1 Tax=Xanthocytophaga agilis TaxID=3048010 RepID=A0AAE3R5W7_9BACT|nr:FkbM family methyltransferase [Xanthocytophaga agilis]MDJ1502182.1 FkbM family methyltransferase [Xanthocytophaga agilis]
MIKKITKKIARSFGFEIRKIKNISNGLPKQAITTVIPPSPDTMLSGLQRCSQREFFPNTVIDIGAAQGTWTHQAMQVWPKSNYILFEPLEERKEELSALASRHTNISIVHSGAGKEKTTVSFYVAEDLDGSGVAHNRTEEECRTIDVTTVDDEIARLQLPGPYLLKLDTHGYEVPIFEGASDTLKQTEVIVVECYGFQIAQNSLLFWEMCQYLDEKGFRLIDIVDTMRREKDHAFWQCDAFFIPKTSKVFTKNTYK